MFDMKEVYDTIEQLEQAPLTLQNVQELSCLYIIRSEHEKVPYGANKYVLKEYKDILPSYTSYADAKRRYQLGELSEDMMLSHLESLCKEISEFLNLLYCDSDLWKERKIINKTIRDLKEDCERKII